MRQIVAAATLFFAATSFVVGPGLAFAAGKKTETEGQQVSMDQLPDPVKSTLERESKGGTVGRVMQETDKKGKTFYEAEIDKNGKKRFVHVADDGKVLKHESARKEAREERREK